MSNLEAICRICGKTKTDGLKNMFGTSFLRGVEQITGMIFKNKRYLPQNICRECRQDLKNAITFRSRCIKMQYYFNYQRLKQVSAGVKKIDVMNISESEAESLSESLSSMAESKTEITIEESFMEEEEVDLVKESVVFERLDMLDESLTFLQEDNENTTNEETVNEETINEETINEETVNEETLNEETLNEYVKNEHITKEIIKNYEFEEIENCTEHEFETIEAQIMKEIENNQVNAEDNNDNVHNKIIAEKEVIKYTIDVVTEDKSKKAAGKPRKKLNRFSCEVCGKYFDNKIHFQIHFNRHEGYKPYECEECPKKFYSRSSLARHINQHKGYRPFECDLCPSKFYSGYELTRHKRIHIRDNANDVETTKKIIKPIETSNTIKTESTSNDDASTLDSKTTTTLIPICEHCGKIFNHVRGLQAHVKRHNAVRRFQCDECPSKFFNNAQLRRHRSGVHTEVAHPISEKYICAECGAHFDNNNHFQTHLNRHEGYKPFECEFCSNKFYTKSELTRHRRFHTGERPYPCQFCHLSFYDSSRRCAHEKSVHTKQCTYSCPYCSQAFILQKRLNLHIKSHGNNPEFHCTLCNKCYKKKKQLNAHYRSQSHKRNEENLLLISENSKEMNENNVDS